MRQFILSCLILICSLTTKANDPISGEYYRLFMVEHNLCERDFLLYFLHHPEIQMMPQFKIIFANGIDGRNALYAKIRAESHDIEKIDHRQKFYDEYYKFTPTAPEAKVWISDVLAFLWGKDIFAKSDRLGQSAALKRYGTQQVRRLNNVDKLFAQRFTQAFKNRYYMSSDEINQLDEAFHRLEVIADLIHRQMQEEDHIERWKRTRSQEYIYEFGHPFRLDSDKGPYWYYPEDKEIALHFLKDPALREIYTKAIHPQNVLSRYKALTEPEDLRSPTVIAEVEKYLISRSASPRLAELLNIIPASNARSCERLLRQ